MVFYYLGSKQGVVRCTLVNFVFYGRFELVLNDFYDLHCKVEF